ncbi:MAG TPA: DUF6259 domain-containing protein [Planctomycetota bacterium]|nr:DUF6259 domain-containing protein [Planctomycetota bacterium]
MPFPLVEETADGVRVSTPFWTVEHHARAGGAWSSLILNRGSGKQLLRAPLTSMLRFVEPNPRGEDGIFTAFSERNDSSARLRLEHSPTGAPVVVAEGVYRGEDGKTVPVGFRRKTEYQKHGLIWTTLEIMSDAGCDGVVELRALDLALRPGLTDAYVRFHPTQDGGSDLLGGRGWFDLKKPGTAFLSRYTPTQMLLMERNVEGIELFPGSDLAQWDCSVKPDMGLGLYMINQDATGTSVELNPYCMAFRRMKVRVQGVLTFKLGFGLPELKPREKTGSTVFHAGTGSRWASDRDIKTLADSGVKLLRFHNDYREDGPFWHDGAYPPYDEAGMKELRRVVNTAHEYGMKIIPYISLKEYHPEAPGFARNSREWMHMAAPSVDMIHTWAGSGEFGALMCMKSGWLDFRKKNVETILSDLPWDGLYFDWTSFHPCCHPSHARGPFHTDVEQFLDFLFFCRDRVGENGFFFLHISGLPSIVAENVANMVFILEDQMGIAPRPGEFPVQCDFIPTAPRQLVGGAAGGSEMARRFIMGGFLQGHPPCTGVPIDGFSAESLQEMALFADVRLEEYDFWRATDAVVATGHKDVFGAAWTRENAALVYLGNFSSLPLTGKLTSEKIARVFTSKRELTWELRLPGSSERVASGKIAASQLAGPAGLPWRLSELGSGLIVIRAE